MKKNHYVVIVLIIIAIATFLFFSKGRERMDTSPLWEYSKNLNPCQNYSQDAICLNIETPPEEISILLENAIIDDVYKKSVLLMYLKLYAYQINKYHQGYDIRQYSIKKITPSHYKVQTKSFVNIVGNQEFLSASEAYDYVLEKRKYLLDVKEIKEQVDKISESFLEIERLNEEFEISKN